MIIDVKATRNDPKAQTGNQPYRFKEEPKGSAKPLAFGIFLASVALYLKSIFPGWGNGEAEARPEPFPEKAQLDGDAQHLADAGFEETGAGDGGSSGKLIDLYQRLSFDSILSPEMELPNYDAFGPISAGPFSLVGPFMVANDNPAPAGTVPDGSGPVVSGPDNPAPVGTVPDGSGPVVTGPDNPAPAVTVPDGSGPVVTGPDNPDQPDGSGDNGSDDDEEDDDDDDTEEFNRAPRVGGPVYLADVAGCSIALIGLSDLLANATDPDGDMLSVKNISISSGTLTQTQGGWLFDAAGYGPVTVTYEISDGALSVWQMAHLEVVRNSVTVGSGDDLLVGTECADDIDGGAGHDNIDARGGSDTIVGGTGNDHIEAGAGADTVFAGLGNDIVFGGAGDDWISGGQGDDRLFGEAGNDTLFGDEGNDRLSGGLDNDLLFGGDGDDELLGDEDNDRLSGGAGNDDLSGGEGDDVALGEEGSDKVSGGAGHDTLSGGQGVDEVFGDAGHDTVLGDLDGAADSYDGGEGFDTLSYLAARQAVEVDLDAGMATGAEVGEDEFCFFEAVETGAGDDKIIGSAAGERLSGNGGDDRIGGADGNDIISGGDGHDTLSGGQGVDEVFGDAGHDTVLGDLDGAADSYDGGEGIDTIDYSTATTGMSFNLASGHVSGDEVGEDTISNFEVFVGGTGDDHFRGNGHGGSFHGGGGDDVFEFEALSSAGQRVAYEILDFMAGDRIKVSRYEIFEEVMDSLEDRFEDIYGDDIDDDDLPILISHERTGEVRRTLIEADLNNDDFYELAITIVGDSQVTVTETV